MVLVKFLLSSKEYSVYSVSSEDPEWSLSLPPKFLSRRSQQTDVDNGFAFCWLLSSSFLVPPNLGNSLKMRERYKPDCDPCSPSIWRHWK